ncbi:hypothetical protein PMG11_11017 [Penicillium brasilianum]|uniref:Uncharacterized protein n=1 Tax=Penicillium brasilianum TaxID=104259 RepID=A0A0F7U491_PENBI|nr:hypothetical protein PMG11_11017 [Penicillium brasilianum]
MSQPDQGMTFVSDISARPRAFKTGNHKNASMSRPVPARNLYPSSLRTILLSGCQRAGFHFRHSKLFLNQYSDFSDIMRSGMASGISPEPLQLHELYHPDNRL